MAKYIIKTALILSLLTELLLPLLNLVQKNKMQFLPLMVNSVTCAIINLIWLGKIYFNTLKDEVKR